MKKVMIFLLAAGLLTACNNKKEKDDRNSTNREQDDYNSRDNGSKDNTDNKKPDDNTSTTDNNTNDRPADNTSANWPASEVSAFITNCVSSAQGGKMDAALAQRYCDCMQIKMEQLYPDIRDAAKLTSEDMESPSMQRLVKDCLR